MGNGATRDHARVAGAPSDQRVRRLLDQKNLSYENDSCGGPRKAEGCGTGLLGKAAVTGRMGVGAETIA
jgi:hypothetical protein